MDELQDAKAQVEAHREGLRKVEDELRAALEEQEELQPKGLLGMFRAAPDPARVEELEAVVEVLKEELKIRRQTFQKALQAVEEQETSITRGSVLPAMVVDLETAVVAVQGLRHLDRLFSELRSIAARAEQARDAVSLTRTNRRGRRWMDQAAAARKTSAVTEQTDNWEPLVDQAEIVADLVTFPLMLPRRWDPAARPAHAPQPTAEVALARQAAIARDIESFGIAMSFTRTELDQLRRKAWNMMEAVKERYPEAEGRAAGQAFDPMEAVAHVPPPTTPTDPSSGAAWSELQALWEDLRSTHDALAALSARGARTVDYLDGMGRWQRLAQDVGKLPLAREHQLVPPVNEGGDLQAFVVRLLSAWPQLDARFEQLRGQHGP